jgi:hypothetical protein
MKKILVVAVLLIALVVVVLNTSLVSNEAMDWVAANPKDPNAPEVLYRVGRWCDVMGSDERAKSLYLQLVQQYPKRGDLCAPALYYVASDLANGSYIVALRKQAQPYLRTILDQYPDQEAWRTKAQQLSDELDKTH